MAFGKQPRLYKGGAGAKYAGTTDLKCWFGPNRLVYIIDFKTGGMLKGEAKKKGYAEWPLQTAGYRQAEDAQGNGVVHLNKKTGEMSWFDYSETYLKDVRAFNLLCEFWRNRNAKLLIDGLPSATTITGQLDKSGPLTWWAVNSMREYLFDKLEEPGKQGEFIFTKEMLYPLIEEARKNFRSVGKKARDIGTLVHEAIEQWFKSKIEPSKNSPDEVIAAFLAFFEWMEQNQVEVIATEKVVYGRY